MYTIRNKDGILIAKVSDAVAKNIILEYKGYFKNDKKFYLNEDLVYSPVYDIRSPYYTKIYIWEGSYIYED